MPNGILVDMMTYKVIGEIDYDKSKKVDGLYYKVGKDLIPAAYIFPLHNRKPVEVQLERLQKAKKAYEDITAEIYYNIFPNLR